MSFFPPSESVPDLLETNEFVLMPLRPGHVDIDYEAVMSSRDMLRKWSGSPWPREDFTLAENLADLQWHDQEHRERTAFTYTVLNPGKDSCLGCVYVRPLADLTDSNPSALDGINEDEAIARFWVRSALLDDGLDQRLLAALRKWFTSSWPFSRLYFHTRSANQQQIALFNDARLPMELTLQYARRGGQHYFYRVVPPS